MFLIRTYKIKNLNFILLSVIFLIFALAIPPFVAFPDSYMYLNSADVLFTPRFFSEYQWFKEPLYPVSLKFISILFGKNDFFYTLFHSLLFLISIYLLLKSFKLLEKLKFINLLILIIFLFNPYFMAWTSMVLQTSMFIFFLSLITYLNFEVLTINKINNIKWFMVNLFAFTFAIQIGIISLVCHVAANLYLYLIKNNSKQNIIQLFIQIFFCIFLIVAWDNYKKNNLINYAKFLPSYNTDYYTKAEQLIMPFDSELPRQFLKHTQALLNLSDLSLKSTEVKQFVETSFSGNYNCGLWYPSENAYLIQKISSETKTNCKNTFLIEIYSEIVPFGEILWRISMSMIIFSLFFYLMVRNLSIFILNIPSFLFLFSYSLLIFVTDRYIFALYVYGMINIIYILNHILTNKTFVPIIKNVSFKRKMI